MYAWRQPRPKAEAMRPLHFTRVKICKFQQYVSQVLRVRSKLVSFQGGFKFNRDIWKARIAQHDQPKDIAIAFRNDRDPLRTFKRYEKQKVGLADSPSETGFLVFGILVICREASSPGGRA